MLGYIIFIILLVRRCMFDIAFAAIIEALMSWWMSGGRCGMWMEGLFINNLLFWVYVQM